MLAITMLAVGASLVAAQDNYPPPAVLLTTTKSGVLPVLPTPFSGVETLEGAIINKAPVDPSYTPVFGPATVQTALPAATYVATLPAVAFDSLTGTTISGSISGSAKQGDTGTTFSVNFANFPSLSEYGPFVYHIHNLPVPADGNCTATMGHLDTTNAGEYYTCDTAATQLCQVGDLAGKHGSINSTTFTASYVDDYLSTDPSSGYFFGDLSVVIHTNNATRLTCANFTMTSSNATASSTPSTTANSTATMTATPSVYSGAADKAAAGGAVMGLAALFGLLL